MADGVSIAENASTGATWARCGACRANRRLDDQGLCCECSPDPLKVELVELREEVASYRADSGSRKPMPKRLAELQQLADTLGRAEAELHREVSRLRKANGRSSSRNRELRQDLAELQHLRGVHFVLPLTEAEHLVLMAVMVDVIAEDPDIPTLAIHRKLTADPV